LLGVGSGPREGLSELVPQRIVEELVKSGDTDLQDLLKTPKSIELDAAQAESLVAGLTRKVSLIQGPPGTILSECVCVCGKTQLR
jgi:hypothetical protein